MPFCWRSTHKTSSATGKLDISTGLSLGHMFWISTRVFSISSTIKLPRHGEGQLFRDQSSRFKKDRILEENSMQYVFCQLLWWPFHRGDLLQYVTQADHSCTAHLMSSDSYQILIGQKYHSFLSLPLMHSITHTDAHTPAYSPPPLHTHTHKHKHTHTPYISSNPLSHTGTPSLSVRVCVLFSH